MKLCKVLALLALVLVLVHTGVVQVLGTLPNQMKSARMTGATLASTIHTQVGNLETAITDILGVPINTDIARAGFVWSAAGLERVRFWAISDPGSPVSGDEWISSTTANTRKYYDGTDTRSLVDLSLTQTLTNKQMTTIELGHATDTTLARAAAGRMTVEGVEVLRTTGMKKFDLARKNAETQVVNNSTTLVNDDTLLTALAANETVSFFFIIWHSSNTTAVFKGTITAPGGSAVRVGQANTLIYESGGTVSQDIIYSASAAATTPLQGNGSGLGIIVSGYVANGSTAGNLQLQWAQNTATAVNTYVMTGSYLLVFRE